MGPPGRMLRPAGWHPPASSCHNRTGRSGVPRWQARPRRGWNFLQVDMKIPLLQGLIMMALPVLVTAWYRRRTHLSWGIFVAGAGGFIVSQLIHFPLLFLLAKPMA